MNVILRDMIYKELIIHINDLIILRRNYKQHVEALRWVPQGLQDQQFWLQERTWQYLTKHSDIQRHISTPDGLSTDPLKVQKIFDFPEPRDKRYLQAFIGIVHYLSKLLPNLASTAAILTNLQGTTRTCRGTDTHLQVLDQCKDLIHNCQVIKPWHNTNAGPKYLICDASDIWLGSGPEQRILDRIRPVRFYCGIHSVPFVELILLFTYC